MNVAVVLAGGIGSRFGSSIPKQYIRIHGKPVIGYVIDALKQSERTDIIMVVAGDSFLHTISENYSVPTIRGGESRNQTVYNALQWIRTEYPECNKVLFADSARPMLTSEYVDRVFDLLDTYDGVVTAAKITDSLATKQDYHLVNREEYSLIQTPEAFRLTSLNEFDPDSPFTAIMEQCTSRNIFLCYDLCPNFKITYPMDIVIAEALLGEKK